MSRTKVLIKQHKKIKTLINNLEKIITNEDIKTKEVAKNIRKNLSMLSGTLKIHMQREDKFLYPELLESDKESTKKLTKEFIEEMGDLADKFKTFNDKYKRYSIISENDEVFKDELEEYLFILKNRISREENEIYSLI